MAKSVLFVTTETSGSQSLWRIQSSIVKGSLKPSTPAGRDGKKPTLAELEPNDHLYIVRGVGELAGPIYSPDFRYVVNVRDPRDMVCNQYYWLMQHPDNGAKTPTEAEARQQQRQRTFDAGIDAFALSTDKHKAFDFTSKLMDTPGADAVFVSYNQLCCGFAGMIERLADFYGFGFSKHAEKVCEKESPDHLANNDKWIGQKWVGTDTMPGRHKAELKPATIATLDRRYDALLTKLKPFERDELRHYYDASTASATV